MIIANQTKHVLGLELDSRDTIATFWQIVYASSKALAGFSTPALIVSGFTALSYIILQYKLKSLPNVAITLILGSVFHFLLQDTIGSVQTLATFDSSLGILSTIHFESLSHSSGTILWASIAISASLSFQGRGVT